jgi:hypothetical protein
MAGLSDCVQDDEDFKCTTSVPTATLSIMDEICKQYYNL